MNNCPACGNPVQHGVEMHPECDREVGQGWVDHDRQRVVREAAETIQALRRAIATQEEVIRKYSRGL